MRIEVRDDADESLPEILIDSSDATGAANMGYPYLAGNPALSSTPLTIPATKAAQLSWPMSFGTEMNLFTNKSLSLIMYSSSACVQEQSTYSQKHAHDQHE